MNNMYVQVLIQWLFLFAIISIVLLPALLFRKIAMQNNKKGWSYFLLGLGIGILILQAGRLVPFFVKRSDLPEQYHIYAAIPMLVICYTLVFVAVKVFRRKVSIHL